MTCDSLMLRRIVSELAPLAGLRLQRILPLGRAQLVLELRTRDPLGQIVVSGNPDAPRLHLARELEPVPKADTPLSDVARRHLRGATFIGAEQLAFDRVVRLHFANCEGLGPQSRRELVVEVSGRHTNLLLLDEQQIILECARHVTAQVNRVRQSLPGELYTPPPDFGKLDPTNLTAPELAALVPENPVTVGEWLRRCLQGASDVFLAVLAEQSLVPRETSTLDLDENSYHRLTLVMTNLLAEAATTGPGYVAAPPGGRPVAYPVALPPHWNELGILPSLSAALGVVSTHQTESQDTEQLRQRLRSCLQAAQARAIRCVEAREQTLQSAAEAESERHLGELILANLHVLSPGQEQLEVTDWETGEVMSLPLDPALTPVENAQRHFARYKKLQRVRERVPPLLQEAQAEHADLEDLLDQVAEADQQQLLLVEEELLERGLLKTLKRSRPQSRAEYRRTETSDGHAVLYGRNSLENAAVLRAARPDDLWFHVQGAPGGHVLLRTNNRPEAVPESVLREAARLAARQSLRRRETTVPVDYTLAKHLTRTRGAAPGQVVYREFRTLLVRPRD